MPELTAVIYRHGTDDYEIWTLDLPESAVTEIENILNRYIDTGCSVRGTAKEIGKEITP